MIQWCSLSCVLEVEGGKASSLPALGLWLVLMEWEPFAWVPWGVYIGLPPRGTMVIWPGVGPGYQYLWPPASPPTTKALFLVGPADRSGTEPIGRSRRWRVWLVAVHYSRAANDAGLVCSVWLQSRRLVGDHYSHTLSHQVNGALTSREGTAACWRPAFPRSDWFDIRRLPGYHCLIGPTTRRPYRQVVVGNRAPPV